MENNTLIETIESGIEFALSNLHTSIIARVTAVNATTINAKPISNRVVDGASIELPEFAEIPVLWLSGGTSSIRHPIKIGDYALLIVIERCIDDWHGGLDHVSPSESRMHDYSDCIAIVGLYNEATAKLIPTVTTFDGDIIHNGNMTINGNLIVNGNITSTGSVTATVDVTAGGISLKNHVHSGITAGTASTGAAE